MQHGKFAHFWDQLTKTAAIVENSPFFIPSLPTFSLRVFKLESITVPPFDRKFSVDLENGVIFEIEGARF